MHKVLSVCINVWSSEAGEQLYTWHTIQPLFTTWNSLTTCSTSLTSTHSSWQHRLRKACLDVPQPMGSYAHACTGSALLNIGLVFVSASGTQMLRQSLLLFATALAVVVYRKPLNRLHFIGLGSCLVSGPRLTKPVAAPNLQPGP